MNKIDSRKIYIVFYHSRRGYKIYKLLNKKKIQIQCIPMYGGIVHRLVNFTGVVTQLVRRPNALILDNPDLRMPILGFLAKVFRVKVILRVRGDQWAVYKDKNARFRLLVLRYASSFVDRFIPVSEMLADRLAKEGIDTKRIAVINTPVFDFEYALEKSVKERDLILLVTNFYFAGKVAKLKKTLYIISNKQAECKTKYKVVIIGGGPLLPEVKNEVANNPSASGVTFLNTCTQDEVLSYYHRARFFVHCSDFDAFPSVVQEAQLCGLPAIIYGINGGREIVVPGLTGFICETDAELSSAVMQLLINDAMIEEMGIKARLNSKRWSVYNLSVEFEQVIMSTCYHSLD